MFDPPTEETRMITSLNAAVSATRDADRLAAAARRHDAPASASPRFERVRAMWRGRRAAPPHLSRPRAA
jgi:hypothetical protein